MTDTSADRPLLDTLRAIQARGAIGERSLTQAVAHSDRFVDLIPAGARSLADLGSGGGLPALVIAWRRPELAVTLVERRTSRADLLIRAVSALGLDRVTVAATDVAELVSSDQRFDVVTARSFADLGRTVGAIDALLGEAGLGLVSEPPQDRSAIWSAVLRGHPLLIDGGVHQGIHRLLRSHGST